MNLNIKMHVELTCILLSDIIRIYVTYKRILKGEVHGNIHLFSDSQYEKFVKSIMDTKLYVVEKDCTDVLDIDILWELLLPSLWKWRRMERTPRKI